MPRITLALGALAALMFSTFGCAPPAHADLNGFADFTPANTNGHGTALGLSDDKATLTLTDSGPDEASSDFAKTPQRVTSWTASFTYQATPGVQGGGDGVAFVLQNDPRGAAAIGDTSAGNALGYGGKTPVMRSAAFLLNIFSGSGAAVVTNGAPPDYGDTDMVDASSGHPIHISLEYDGAVLTETFQDTATGDTFTQEDAVDIPKAVGAATALVGFSGASGSATAKQTVRDFAFTVRPDVPPAQRKRIVKTAKIHNGRASYVDPFIGTGGDGNTFPGAVAPFGMVQFSPDTSSPSIGYKYNQRQIQGFSLTHLSGVGCDDEGNVFLTATTGPIQTQVADYQSSYSHQRELASPGAYSVRLSKWDINADLTATERAGLIRFTFPAGQAGNILVPISHTLTKTRAADIKIVGDSEIQGSMTSQSFCGAKQYYTVYFVMKLDRPFAKYGTFTGDAVADASRTTAQSEGQPDVGAFVTYGADGPRTVTARIGISYVDLEGARRNLDGEAGTRSFDAVRSQTAKKWENELGVIDINGGTDDQRTIFYTALYHCLQMPSLFSDADGRYTGYDDKIHQMSAGHSLYANYSGWDIYRDEAPLLALIAPQRMQDMCQSIVLMYQQGGWIDRWPQANTYTNVMCGSPLTSVIATAWGYGLHGFDMTTAYEGMWKDATQRPPPGKPYAGESNVEYIDKLGYIPDDKEGYGSVSQTEEDCYAYAA
ncbi:MAG: GH92 family glycosyl hydrolase, partial [Armatimonadota bacterium]|nr:GH92 family glycosyl hydrolase [Armatimonadota bacterium]